MGGLAECNQGPLPGGESVRPGATRDMITLCWMVETSPWVHWPTGQETLRELLAQEASLVWLRGAVLRAAMIYSLYRQPVATARVLVVREREDLAPFFARVLPAMESEMAQEHLSWMSFLHCEPWLAEGLAAAGYRVRDRVLNLRKRGLQTTLTGNREVLVRSAAPSDHEPLVALDAQCFEPFWQLNAGIVRRAIDTSPYVLVAEAGGELLGYLMAERHSEGEAYISRVGVLPPAQGHGIGTRLLVEALDRMARDGLRGVRLNTQENNMQSRAVYASLGFEIEGSPEAVWAKTLRDA